MFFMSRFVNRKSILSVLIALVAGFSAGFSLRSGSAVHANGAPFASFGDFVKWVATHHKAPFDRDNIAYQVKGATSTSKTHTKNFTTAPFTGTGTNVMVNQDRNP
jgi:hypothetical protein